MLALIILLGVVAVAWRLSYWPFDRGYSFLPKYGSREAAKILPTSGPKPGP
jgi:hypothetical protein